MYPKKLYLNGDPASHSLTIVDEEQERIYREGKMHADYRESVQPVEMLVEPRRRGRPPKDATCQP